MGLSVALVTAVLARNGSSMCEMVNQHNPISDIAKCRGVLTSWLLVAAHHCGCKYHPCTVGLHHGLDDSTVSDHAVSRMHPITARN